MMRCISMPSLGSERLLKKAEILILDDDAVALDTLRVVLEEEGYGVHSCSLPAEAEECLRRRRFDLAVLDLNLPDRTGLELLQAWKRKFPDLDILFCSGEVKVARAIECLRQGAADYVVKPFQKDDMLLIVRRTLEKQELKKKVEKLRPLVLPAPVEFVASSAKMKELLEKVKLLRKHVHLNVLILGESGTGKEVVARLLYQQEEDEHRPFVVVNMPAIPASLMESELFGAEKGAFTDAKTSRAGRFELADGGDILLDEIGDLAPETQAKILRTLQEKQIERLGSQRSRQVEFRVISATNRPLADLMSNGQFREDLIYRLSDMVLWIPPLRERPDDIPELARHFVRKYSTAQQSPREISDDAIATLCTYHWPGNVRQLESTIKRALIFNRGSVLETVEIYDPMMMNPTRDTVPALEGEYEAQLAGFERKLIEAALRRHRGDRQATIKQLKLSRATFYRKLNQLGIGL